MGKQKEMTGTQHVGTLKHQFIYIYIVVALTVQMFVRSWPKKPTGLIAEIQTVLESARRGEGPIF
jgi:hypothetical protein